MNEYEKENQSLNADQDIDLFIHLFIFSLIIFRD